MPQSMGPKLRYGRPCPHDLPGTHNWLAQLTLLPFSRFQLTISCWHNPGSLEWVPVPLAWLTPWPAPERLCLWFFDMHTDPPFTQFAPKRWQSTGLELRILVICLKFRGSGPEINWRPPPKKIKPHRGTTPPHPFPDLTHIYTNQYLSM